MKEPRGRFEMRRLESLSNTIFGVAMTLLASGLPRGEFATLPGWADLYQLYHRRLIGLVLSFVIAALFWLSHHRRLARAPEGSRDVVLLNLLFLLFIVLLPVSNALYGSYSLSSAVAVLYGGHLAIIAGLNAWLWWLATEGGAREELAAAVFPVLVFVPGTIVAAVAPHYAQYIWYVAFAGLLVRRHFAGHAAS